MGDSLATTDMGRKLLCVTLFSGGGEEQSSMQHNVAWADACLHTKWNLDPSRRLATIDMG